MTDTDIFRDHAANPRNRLAAGAVEPRCLDGFDGVGSSGSAALRSEASGSKTSSPPSGGQCDDKITVFIRVTGDIITDIAFQTSGCDAAVACGSVTTELARGKDLDQAAEITGETISRALGGLPREYQHVAAGAAEALGNAIWDHIVRSVNQRLEETQ